MGRSAWIVHDGLIRQFIDQARNSRIAEYPKFVVDRINILEVATFTLSCLDGYQFYFRNPLAEITCLLSPATIRVPSCLSDRRGAVERSSPNTAISKSAFMLGS